MPTKSMLGYVQQVLSKVTFDLVLFEKELRKSIRLLVEEEVPQLKRWCLDTFTTRPLRLVVERCFRFALAVE